MIEEVSPHEPTEALIQAIRQYRSDQVQEQIDLATQFWWERDQRQRYALYIARLLGPRHPIGRYGAAAETDRSDQAMAELMRMVDELIDHHIERVTKPGWIFTEGR